MTRKATSRFLGFGGFFLKSPHKTAFPRVPEGNPPLVRFPSFRLRRKFTLLWRFWKHKACRSLRRATSARALERRPLFEKSGGKTNPVKKFKMLQQFFPCFVLVKLFAKACGVEGQSPPSRPFRGTPHLCGSPLFACVENSPFCGAFEG